MSATNQAISDGYHRVQRNVLGLSSAAQRWKLDRDPERRIPTWAWWRGETSGLKKPRVGGSIPCHRGAWDQLASGCVRGPWSARLFRAVTVSSRRHDAALGTTGTLAPRTHVTTVDCEASELGRDERTLLPILDRTHIVALPGERPAFGRMRWLHVVSCQQLSA